MKGASGAVVKGNGGSEISNADLLKLRGFLRGRIGIVEMAGIFDWRWVEMLKWRGFSWCLVLVVPRKDREGSEWEAE
jgi:hypothetical protein